MAPTTTPREVSKPTTTASKAQRVLKTAAAPSKTRSTPASPAILKKAVLSVKKTIRNVRAPLKMNSTTQEVRQRTNTVPKIGTPTKENKPAATPATVTKSAKKPAWKRRPMPAHSGVPVPEKMRQLLMQRQLRHSDNDF